MTDTETSAELVPSGNEVEKYIADVNKVAVEDAEAVSLAIVARYLRATTVEEVLTPSVAVGARDLAGDVVTIHGVHFNRSAYEGREGVYAVADVVSERYDRPFAMTCGSRNVMAQLFRLAQLKAFPVDVKVVESPTQTAAGYKPMWLEPGHAPPFKEADQQG